MGVKAKPVGAFIALLALAACDDRKPEVDQIAQRSMIGLSRKHVLACLGKPALRKPVGTEEIWTYPIGEMRTEGGLLALGLNDSVSPFPASRPCRVDIVIDRYGVSQVRYAAPDGGALPLGQRCLFDVGKCVGPL
jgi:hypothetical protein